MSVNFGGFNGGYNNYNYNRCCAAGHNDGLKKDIKTLEEDIRVDIGKRDKHHGTIYDSENFK